MIINPIIPIWLMTIICISLSILVIYNKQIKEIKNRKKEQTQINSKTSNNITGSKISNSIVNSKLMKKYVIKATNKIAIIILLFIMNLRIMIPNAESTAISSDLSILFVIDKSVSMKALDYDGNKERIEGVINDCCYIVDELSNCKFSIITFGDTAQKIIPFTHDTDMVQAELKATTLEDDFYAKGSSMNIVKDILETTLKNENEKNNENSKAIVFFITDGEITKEGEKLETFSNLSPYISNGAVLGYGTRSRSKNGKQKLWKWSQ